ncbi:MAG: LytR/AlgR family response regulator transcription factor [Wujia sp.]
MRLGICDDERRDVQKVITYLKSTTWANSCDIKIYEPNVLLLDVEEGIFNCDILIMDVFFENLEIDGIALAVKINQALPVCEIIYLTNMLEYATRVYETKHCYFILKKDMEIVLEQALKKAFNSCQNREKSGFLSFICDGHKVYVNEKDILYIEREGRRVNIVTNDRKYNCYQSLSRLQEILDKSIIRVHGGYMVNLNAVSYIGNKSIELTCGDSIPVGRTYEKEVRKYYRDFYIKDMEGEKEKQNEKK